MGGSGARNRTSGTAHRVAGAALCLASAVMYLPLGACSGQTRGAPATDTLFGRYDLSASQARQYALPASLREISGLATTRGGELLAHNDESAAVWAIDPRTGNARAMLTGHAARGDFEGIAVAGDRVILTTSDGLLVEYARGATSTRTVATGLGSRCEIEGMDYDARAKALLLACKRAREAELAGRLVVWAVPLATMRAAPAPRLRVPFARLLGPRAGKNALHPSALAIDPQTGHLLVLAARERLLLELTRTGELVRAARFSASEHPQPEGIAVLDDGTLAISDEGGGGHGRITFYPAARSAIP